MVCTGAWIASSRKARAIVGADPVEPDHLGLHQDPAEGRTGDRGLEEHHRTAPSTTHRMETVPADVDQQARGRELPPASARPDRLIEHTERHGGRNDAEYGDPQSLILG